MDKNNTLKMIADISNAMGISGYALASLLFLCGFRKPGRAPYIGMDGGKLFLTAGSCAVFSGSGCFPP